MDPAICVAEDVAHSTANPFHHPGRPGGVVLELRITDRDLLEDRHRVAVSPKLGPILLGRLRTWLLNADTITINPVVDLDPRAHPPVDEHDPPARMAAMVRHRDPTCVYPACTRPSAHADLDHIDAYVPLDQGGPPGQTRPANLAPLCRRHHRAKTFGHSTYQRLPDSGYEWTLPTGRTTTTHPPTPRPEPPPGPAPSPPAPRDHRRT
ncbi:hypothetical protein GCM10009797_23120 [Nocardioides hwasunensis]